MIANLLAGPVAWVAHALYCVSCLVGPVHGHLLSLSCLIARCSLDIQVQVAGLTQCLRALAFLHAFLPAM